ncbi:MAG TPA: hypothetical protein VGQ06_08375 [Gemmatimonadales bacterium]|nr:hypothetical protein [Gemmatimonadales bacterium]
MFAALVLAAWAAPPARAAAQGYDPKLFAELRWRLIGPFRGGRTVGATGVPGQPNVFYIGVNNGGVWRTTDYGRSWTPIFDAQATGSIGAIAVAPSDPNVIYVGSGEGLQRPDLSVGDGIYKSTDGGQTWRHLGLQDGQQIPMIIVDPRDPNRVFAAVLGHPYGPNPERGIFRSTDGGATWDKVLYKDENTGGMDLAFDPANPQTVLAVLWSARQAPWEAGWVLSANNGLYKSTDGGTTWRQITTGLPGAQDGLGRIGLGTSVSEPARMYAVVGARSGGGLYRSDDGGESWRLVNSDGRLWGRDGDFNEVKVDPKNADVVYVANIVTWKSTDGGTSFVGWRGAPGGDDYHRLWINPDTPQIILNASDQGAVITVNGGETWSSWYNQPTAQMFHVATDNRFPYWVYGGQQESGSAGVPSRGNDGQITFREWHPVGAEEYGYVVPDPLHPNLIYGGKLTRFDWATGEVKNVAPAPLREPYRFVRTAPVIFSPVDPRILYYAGNVLFKTLNGGESWQVISPDLTREQYEVPPTLGAFTSLDPEKGKHRGVIYTIAPSFRRVNLLWVGTDDGLIWITHTGGRTWRNVTPPALTPWSKVSIMEASHFDTLKAFAAVNRFRLDDLAPHIFRTKDGGKTWKETVEGIPLNEVVNVVREDPVRRGLLFAGTERSVYVSFDDGDHWQSLRQNLPPSSMRDLYIHDADLVVGTHGRSIWILDDFSPLRQIAAAARTTSAYLFRPAPAYRVRWNQNTDTPLPPDEPAGKNPPDGAIIDYYLGAAAPGAVTLEVRDARGRLVRRFSSADTFPVDSGLNIPDYWIRPPQRLSTEPGMHRFVWDLHYPPPPSAGGSYPISAIYRDTWREPRGPVALPGRYTLRLTAGGRVLSQPLTVRMDPRVRTPAAGLAQQFAYASRLTAAMRRQHEAMRAVRALRARLKAPLDQEATGVVDSLARLGGQLTGLLDLIDGVDAAPTTQAAAAVRTLEARLTALLARWATVRRRLE